MATLQTNKKALRKSISAVLRTLAPGDIQLQSELVVKRLVNSSFFQKSNNVSCYLSMPSGELDTSSLVTEIIQSGKTLFVPKIKSKTEGSMDFLKVHGELDLSTFPAGLWGIKEPDYTWQGAQRQSGLSNSNFIPNRAKQNLVLSVLGSPEGSIDMILLPGVAFDRSLSRLGHGKGYYDRFISAYAAIHNGQRPLLVGLALREQVLDAGKIPMGEWDWKVDSIVSPDAIFGIGSDPSDTVKEGDGSHCMAS